MSDDRRPIPRITIVAMVLIGVALAILSFPVDGLPGAGLGIAAIIVSALTAATIVRTGR